MSKNTPSPHHSLLTVAVLLLATPQIASAYVDPGSGTMLWQLAAAAGLGSLFYVKRAVTWAKENLGKRSRYASGFLFATGFAVVSTLLTVLMFKGHPLPRFNDLFLIGVVLTAYYFRWEPAAYLLAISLLVSAWVLPPAGSFKMAGFDEWYRLISFGFVAAFLIFLIERGKARKRAAASSAAAYPMHGVAAGAD